VEDAFVDPNTPMARRNIDFHCPLSTQLEKIVHEIRGDIYHVDSGTLSDMDSSSTITQDEEKPGVNMADEFSIEVGGFAIACESDVCDKKDITGHDYMYEIGTKFTEPFSMLQDTTDNSSNDNVVTSILPLELSQESYNMDVATEKADSTEEPALLSSPRQTRPSSAPTLRSFQQRNSARIQLKSFSTTSLVPHQPPATVMQKQVTQYHSHTSMSEEFPRWLYSEVVKAGLQFCKPNFIQSPSSSSISSDSSSESVGDESTIDSTDEQSIQVSVNQQSVKAFIGEQSIKAYTDQQSTQVSTDQQSTKVSTDQPSTKKSTDQQSTKTSTDQQSTKTFIYQPQPMEVSINRQKPVPINSAAIRSPVTKSFLPNSDAKSKEQFDHYEAICYLWRGK